MAQLRMTIGGVTATRLIDDAKAAAVANLIFDEVVLPNWPEGVPLPTTAQERLQAVVDRVALQLRDTARACRRRQMEVQQAQANQAELAALDV